MEETEDLLSKQQLRELVAQVTPNFQLDSDVEEVQVLNYNLALISHISDFVKRC